jgi:hypothetical protein
MIGFSLRLKAMHHCRAALRRSRLWMPRLSPRGTPVIALAITDGTCRRAVGLITTKTAAAT